MRGESQHRSDAYAGAGKERKIATRRHVTEAIQTMTQTGRYRKLNVKPPAFGHELSVINVERASVNVIC